NMAPILLQRFAADQSVVIKALDDAAEITGIKPERAADVLGDRLVLMCELVQYARLAQREWALQQMLVAHAELAGVETREGAGRRNLVFGHPVGHGIGHGLGHRPPQ